MIGRIRTRRVDEARAGEYEAFARHVSLPRFRRQPGFCGVAMLRRGEDCAVIPIWEDAESVAELSRSEGYIHSVGEIVAKGFLLGEQTVDIFDVRLRANLPF